MENPSSYYVGVRFPGSEKSYYFATDHKELTIGSLVVVSTINGVEMGTVSTAVMPMSTYQNGLELKPILRLPTKEDMDDYEYNVGQAKRTLEIVQELVERLGLAMDLIDANFVLDGSKVTITYTTPEKRVDFRELLRELAPYLGCRIELRQIAARDKAKMIGGIGICGLPLCCTTFMTQFDGISIQRAKNQMLTLNIPKLSGPCGKLLCCLAYEDETYTIEKKDFPRLGTVVHTDDGDYSVDSMNIISRTVRLVNSTRDDYKTYSLEDVKAMMNGTYKKKEETKKVNEFSLPDFHISATNVRDASYGGNSLHENSAAKPDRNDNNNGNRQGGRRDHGRNRHRGNESRNNNGGNNNQSNQQRNNQNNNQGNQQRNNPNNKGRDQNRNPQNQNRNNNPRPNNQNKGQQQPQNNQQGNQNPNRNNHHRHRHGHRPNNGGNNQNKGE